MAEHVSGGTALDAVHGPRLVMPIMNPVRGKFLFVSKGCVACHAINGVGGHDAPNMDAHNRGGLMNPFDFAAKMWNHAPAMIAAQEEAFGEQVYFTGAELADITAFVHDDRTQHTFADKDLTKKARQMMHHEHGGKPSPKAHAKELGHHEDAPGAKPHKH
jgi:cytochrome c